MKQFALLILTVIMGMAISCCSDDDDKETIIPAGNKSIDLTVTSRVGTVINDDLTNYVESLNLLTFRKNRQGTYVLYQSSVLTKAELKALEAGDGTVTPGFTAKKNVTIGKLPVGTYQVVGLANVLSETGEALPNASLSGVTIGNTMEEVVASVSDGTEAPRFFWGITDPVTLGEQMTATPTLTLNRKVSMFVLTLKDVPEVVSKITLETQNTYGAFDMSGQFQATPVIDVIESSSYNFSSVQDSVIVASISLPTASAAARSTFSVTFTLDNGQEITSPLPQYTLQENTILRLTATVNTEKPGEQWKLDLTFDLMVNVEWNVDQEPSIVI